MFIGFVSHTLTLTLMEQERKDEFTSREKGLLKVASDKKWENVRLEEKLNEAHEFMMSLILKGKLDEEEVWAWVSMMKCQVQVQSKVFGEFTTIDDYERKTKDKKVIKAHFWRGYYHGSIHCLGNKPVSVLAWYKIKKERFTYVPGGATLQQLFVPIEIDEEDMPLSQLRR